jgi:hypothetical protein
MIPWLEKARPWGTGPGKLAEKEDPMSKRTRTSRGPREREGDGTGQMPKLPGTLADFLELEAREARRLKVSRNDPCPCGSGKKYKRCCMDKHRALTARAGGEVSFEEDSSLRRQRELCEEKVREAFDLLSQRRFHQAATLVQRWTKVFPKDERFLEVMVASFIGADRPEEALAVARKGYHLALAEKEFYMSQGCHSWEKGGPSPGYGYAPETWLERLWVSEKAVEYKASCPKPPDPGMMRLVRELQKADDLSLFPKTGREGLEERKRALAPVLEEFSRVGSIALPYLMPLCPKYGWTALLVPEILWGWADKPSIRALIDLAMFHYPYLSESSLEKLERIGPQVLPHLEEAFELHKEFDPLKTGLLSVAREIGTEEAMEWLVRMLEHQSPLIVNWTAGLLGKSKHKEALPSLRRALSRVGEQPYLLWAIEELEGLP